MIVDMATMADLLGVKKRTIHSWRRRGLGFPEPLGRMGVSPYWNWEEVSKWAKATGRLSNES